MEPNEIEAHVNMINEYLDHMERIKKQRIDKAMFKNLGDLKHKLNSEYYLNKINDSKYSDSISNEIINTSINESFDPTNIKIENPQIKIYLINRDLYREEHLVSKTNLSDLLSEWSKWTCDYIIEIVGIVIFRNIETTKLVTPIDTRTEEQKQADFETFMEIFDDLDDLDESDESNDSDN